MQIVTTDNLPGISTSAYQDVKGLVFGIGRGAAPSAGYSLAEKAASAENIRQEAVDNMTQSAREKGANVIVRMRFETTVVGNAVEVVAYGTAVDIGV